MRQRVFLNSDSISLTSGSIAKNMIQFSLPLVCTNLLQVLFSMVDVAVVGKYAGTTALGAVGSTPNLLFLFVGLLTGLGSGVNAIMAYYVGAKDKKSVDETIYTAFLFCIFSGFALCVLGIAFAKTMLSAMNTKPDLLPGAVLYFRIYMVSMPAAAIYNFGNGVFSAIGETKKPLYFLALSGVVNIVLDLLFVICFKMNVAGVAYATVIAQYISAVLMMIFLIRGNGQVHFSLRALQIERTKLARIVSIGLPAGMQELAVEPQQALVPVAREVAVLLPLLAALDHPIPPVLEDERQDEAFVATELHDAVLLLVRDVRHHFHEVRAALDVERAHEGAAAGLHLRNGADERFQVRVPVPPADESREVDDDFGFTHRWPRFRLRIPRACA